MARPSDLFRDPLLTVLASLLALFFLFLAAVPGVLFNKTYEEHYDEISEWLHKRAGLLPGWRAWAGRLAGFWGGGLGLVVFTILGAIVYGFLMPTFGLDLASLVALLGLLAGLVIVMFAFDLPARQYHRARTGDPGHLRVFPGTIVVAIVCVLLSRAANFQPGYLYGLIVSYQFRGEMSEADEGRSAATRSIWALGVSLVAWLALAVVSPPPAAAAGNSPAGGSVSLPLLAIETMLSTVVVAGVEGALFELFPLRFLPGEVVFGWDRRVWAVLFGLSAFAFVAILINPASGYLSSTRTTPLAIAVALFVVFAIVSVGFWGYFRYRPQPPPRPPMARKVAPEPTVPRKKAATRRRKGGGEGGI
ncbi:MAG: FGLLP motif-containing membrane protein [Candidatus Limnocylindrales bacterium]